MNRREDLKNTPSYRAMVGISKLMDNWLVDPLIGFFLPGIGDLVTGAFSVPFIYFALVRLRSIPLTLAVLSNVLKDALLGSIFPTCDSSAPKIIPWLDKNEESEEKGMNSNILCNFFDANDKNIIFATA